MNKPAQGANLHTAGSHENGKPVELNSRSKSRTRLAHSRDHAGNPAEARSRQILSAIIAFRDGDFSARLPAEWAGTDGRIAEAFNQTIAHEERIAQEVTRLSATVAT